jgi:hypothetical protein
MHRFLWKGNNFKALFLFFIFLFIILMIYNVYYPHEAFAMAPPKDYFTVVDYYGYKEYIGQDAYGHFNCRVKPYDIENTYWGKSRNPDYTIPDKPVNYTATSKEVVTKSTEVAKSGYVKPNPGSYELDAKPSNHASQYRHEHEEMHYKSKFYGLNSETWDKHVCKPEHKELNLWVPGQSLRGANPVIYELPSPRVDVIFELDADYYEDTISTSLNSTRFNQGVEFVRNYKVLVDHPKHGVLSSINLGVKTTKNNIISIYIQLKGISRRKVLWNIWEKHKDRYESYKHFKISWDSNTSVFSKIREDIRGNIRSEVEDLLGVKKINKNLKRSVKAEIEKLLREKQPFKY